MKNWDKFICNNFECVFYDQDTDICDFCICNDKEYKQKQWNDNEEQESNTEK